MDGNNKEDKESTIVKGRIEALYKNLEHISHSYFSAEGIFPFWESVYALIVGQLLVAYFTSKNCELKIILILAGIVFSVIWFFVVSIGWHNSVYRANTMKYLQWKLIREYERLNSIEMNDTSSLAYKFYPECPIDKRYYCENIIEWKLYHFRDLFYKLPPSWENLISSWYYRRWIPIILFGFWLFILIHFLM